MFSLTRASIFYSLKFSCLNHKLAFVEKFADNLFIFITYLTFIT